MTRVWDETRFKSNELLVMLCLADHANDEGVCWPSYERIAGRARCSRRTAIRIVLALSNEGWIEIKRRRTGPKENCSNVFRLNLENTGDKLAPVETPFDDEIPPMGDKSEMMGDKTPQGQVTQLCHPNHKEPSIEPSSVRSSTRTKDFPDFDEVYEYLCDLGDLNVIHAAACAERWLQSVESIEVLDWKKCASGFSKKFAEGFKRD